MGLVVSDATEGAAVPPTVGISFPFEAPVDVGVKVLPPLDVPEKE